MLDFLADQPLIAMFLILAVGLAVGKIKVAGLALGASAVLFVALGLSAMNPEISLPTLVYQLGLALFVYAIGLTAGREFFASFLSRGWKLNAFLAVFLLVLVGLTYALVRALGLDPIKGSGMFAGALTSTPAMAAIVDMLDASQGADVVVGYSLAYPGAVIAAIVIAAAGSAILKVDHVADARKEGLIVAPVQWRAISLRSGISGAIRDLPVVADQPVSATRLQLPDGTHTLADPDRPVEPGMVVVLNGTEEALNAAEAVLGEAVPMSLERSGLMFRRLTLSNPNVAGKTVGELDTVAHGFTIARVRRGDSDIAPNDDLVLNYSDRVRVVTTPERLPEVNRFFGDSERSLADLNLLPLALGLLAGLILGAIPIPLPGGSVLSLGFGGGPIIAGLILGALTRTGGINWQIPYHANRTLSTLGLSIFLAGVGTTAGAGFRDALTDASSLYYIAAGFVVTVVVYLVSAAVGMWLLHLTWDEAMGVAAGASTNPAVISYLNEQTGTELAARGYATVYPTGMVGKIIAGQLLVLLLV